MRTLCILPLICVQLTGSTYYIDYTSGSDANAGTSTGAPWKHCPSMAPFSGSYTHADGDTFIFKGGVTWPNAALPLYTTVGGASGNHDVYWSGDHSWYNGGSWTRPIFDAESTVFTNHSTVHRGNVWRIYGGASAYITIADIEMKNWVWNDPIPTSIIDGSCVFADTTSNITVSNIYAHDWVVQVDVDARMGGPLAYNSTDLVFINSTVRAPATVDPTYVTDADGLTSGSGSSWWQTVINCEIDGTTQGIWGAMYADGNVVHDGGDSFDSAMHENGVWIEENAIFKNNVVSNWVEGVGAYFLPGWAGYTNQIMQVHNNIFYNTVTVHLDPSNNVDESNGIIFVNNVIDRPLSTFSVRIGPGNGSAAFGLLCLQNNIYINASGVDYYIDSTNYLGSNYTNSYNVTYNNAGAASCGLTVTNLWYNESNTCSVIDSGIAVVLDDTADKLGTSRPRGSAWDIGPYEYTGSDTTPPSLSSAALSADGTTLTLTMTEATTFGAGGNGGVTISIDGGGATTCTYSSGSGSTSLVYTSATTVYSSQTVTVSYTQPTDGMEDAAGNDVVSWSGSAVTNNSSQTAPAAASGGVLNVTNLTIGG